MNRSYVGTLWMLCVWVITIISINDGKHFAAPCLSNHLFIKSNGVREAHTNKHWHRQFEEHWTIWPHFPNLIDFKIVLTTSISAMNQFKCRKYGRWWRANGEEDEKCQFIELASFFFSRLKTETFFLTIRRRGQYAKWFQSNNPEVKRLICKRDVISNVK